MTTLVGPSARPAMLSPELLNLAVRVARLGVGTVDYGENMVFLDQRAAEIFGLKAETPIPREDLHSHIHPDDISKVNEELKVLFDPAGNHILDLTHRILHHDGQVRWVHVRKQVEFAKDNGSGARKPVSATLALLDITEQKAAEERVQALLSEMHQRTKSLMSIVQSMARLTGRKDSSDLDFIDKFANRLGSMATNHDLLARHGWESIDVRTLIDTHLHPFTEQYEGRILTSGPSVNIKEKAASAIGMAIHELADNAVRFGALSNDTGMVKVGWTVGEEEGAPLLLTWQEFGGPSVAPPAEQGFGEMVIRQMTEKTLGATVNLDFGAEGLSWRLAVPANKVMA